jgi:orotidine-5'-phosphate decarboxylase
MAEHFFDRLTEAVRIKRSPLLVGLDPRWEQLPSGLRHAADEETPIARAAVYLEFCRGVIDVVAPLVAAVKPQAAFFEQLGPAGGAALFEVIRYATAKDLLVIVDGKRNDIGSTAIAYAEAYLGREQSPWGADALTVNPYLGADSLAPFVDVAQERGAGVFVLVKTSNPGSKTFQDIQSGGYPVYLHVAALVEEQAAKTSGLCGYGSVGAVIGATHPGELVDLRDLMPHTWLLVPGFGAQGGSASDVAGAFDNEGLGAIISSSRAIIFAHAREPYADKYGDGEWQQAVEAATLEAIEQIHDATAAGKL